MKDPFSDSSTPSIEGDIQLSDIARDSSPAVSSESDGAVNSSSSPSNKSSSNFSGSIQTNSSDFDESNIQMPEVCPDLDFDIPSITDDREETFSDSPLSLVKTLAVLLSWFSAYPGISKNAFSGLLYILHHFILPSPNNLPSSYKAAT